MVISEKRLRYLLDCFTSGTITADEKQELFEWARQSDDDRFFRNYVSEVYHQAQNDESYYPVEWETVFGRISQKAGLKPERNTKIFSIFSRVTVAAAVSALVLGVAVFYFLQAGNDTPSNSVAAVNPAQSPKVTPENLSPFQAILKTSNNEVILQPGDTTFDLGGNAVKLTSGQLSIADAIAEDYTLITPRGTTYQIVLSDGSAVWLNAASEFTYPSLFTGDERRVKVKGEAYFEVAKDADHPFIVETENQTIQVLGTSFNVQAYAEEPQLVTTLITGSLRVSAGKESVLLSPGQQAEWDDVGKLKLNKKADIAQATAWKDDYFRFRQTELKSMMRQLARWYDLEVVYGDDLKSEYFAGVISRKNDIESVLKMLEATNDVKFSLKNKTLTVSAVK